MSDESTGSGSVEEFDEIWGSAPKSISWDVTPPFEVKGFVVSQESAQQLDIRTRKPMTWDDGRPKMKVILTLQTDLLDPEDPDDDGRRQLHIKRPSALMAAIKDALKQSSFRTPVGKNLSITYTGDGKPAGAGMSPPKEYVALSNLPPPLATSHYRDCSPPEASSTHPPTEPVCVHVGG